MLTADFDRALLLATKHHGPQLRKGSQIPYVSHLLGVTSLVLEAGGDETEAIAALLHDAVEDGGGPPMLAAIERDFGSDVARIVDANSDTDVEPKPEWRVRKENYIAAIAHKQPDELPTRTPSARSNAARASARRESAARPAEPAPRPRVVRRQLGVAAQEVVGLARPVCLDKRVTEPEDRLHVARLEREPRARDLSGVVVLVLLPIAT